MGTPRLHENKIRCDLSDQKGRKRDQEKEKKNKKKKEHDQA
jgi:hypothetical protein